MNNKLNCILLIDDDPYDNYFHERVIRKYNFAETVVVKKNPLDALEFLKSHKAKGEPHPEIIFLDINMPEMNGWEFLEEYNTLEKEVQSNVIVVMLTSDENPDDKMKSRTWDFVPDFKTKPLTKEMLEEILNKHFG